MNKKITISLFIFLSGCTSASVQDRFINAAAEIACVYQSRNVPKDNILPMDIQQQKNQVLQKIMDAAAQKYNFSDPQELNRLSEEYKANSEIIKKTQEKINVLCPNNK